MLPGGDKGTLSTSRFSLPQLQPPKDSLLALLDIPSTAKLHTPITMHLTVRNQRPLRSANVVVQLDLDPVTDGFIVSGLRQGRLPVLLPGAEERLTWNLIPVECGYVKVPKIRVTDRRNVIDSQLAANANANAAAGKPAQSEGEEVRVVDMRTDVQVAGQATASVTVDGPHVGTILVTA